MTAKNEDIMTIDKKILDSIVASVLKMDPSRVDGVIQTVLYPDRVYSEREKLIWKQLISDFDRGDARSSTGAEEVVNVPTELSEYEGSIGLGKPLPGDVLGLERVDYTYHNPLFKTQEQLDSDQEGPYFSLWHAVERNPELRLFANQFSPHSLIRPMPTRAFNAPAVSSIGRIMSSSQYQDAAIHDAKMKLLTDAENKILEEKNALAASQLRERQILETKIQRGQKKENGSNYSQKDLEDLEKKHKSQMDVLEERLARLTKQRQTGLVGVSNEEFAKETDASVRRQELFAATLAAALKSQQPATVIESENPLLLRPTSSTSESQATTSSETKATTSSETKATTSSETTSDLSREGGLDSTLILPSRSRIAERAASASADNNPTRPSRSIDSSLILPSRSRIADSAVPDSLRVLNPNNPRWDDEEYLSKLDWQGNLAYGPINDPLRKTLLRVPADYEPPIRRTDFGKTPSAVSVPRFAISHPVRPFHGDELPDAHRDITMEKLADPEGQARFVMPAPPAGGVSVANVTRLSTQPDRQSQLSSDHNALHNLAQNNALQQSTLVYRDDEGDDDDAYVLLEDDDRLLPQALPQALQQSTLSRADDGNADISSTSSIQKFKKGRTRRIRNPFKKQFNSKVR